MEIELSELMVKILGETAVRSAVIKVQNFAPVAGSLLLQRRGSGQYNIAVAHIEMHKVEKALKYFIDEVSVKPSNVTIPRELLKPFAGTILGLVLPSSKLQIDYDVMLSMYWNGPFGNFVFTRQIKNEDKEAMSRVSDFYYEQIMNDEVLSDVVLK